ncbi:MAG TPA: hypothetical protein PKC39_04415 [Ferruginibacter sp.]|nr:hypothetical protein [Ferruginibacter sp.]HMP20183.1 hypothetical protein [Ferruginibacter sp.]
MVSYIKKNRFFKIGINWFEYDKAQKNNLLFNAYFHVKSNNGARVPGIRKDAYTIEIDLTEPEDTIFSKFAKQVRQQYRITEKENINCYFHKDTKRFVDFFNDFALKRNTYPTSIERIEEMGENLILSFAERDGQLLVAHSYLTDPKMGIVRFNHSATTRLEDNTDKNLVGRVNKYMVVKSMFYFKAQGYKIFDMGGYAMHTTDAGLAGINKFKEQFGSNIVTCANYYSYSYWFLKKLSGILGVKSDA